ncbi:MAG: UDP-N-acetylglucosamine pyrophosphorylase [Verrucomicrobia bacterium]|nr:UDP-N-acetylglucosamine pyrophosphorylase [Verrucomicrobiota bacterium]MCH8526523.1 UDP-N-acetylglucosamine pyrophosphorylase [Kiritimatiellia bacterium]
MDIPLPPSFPLDDDAKIIKLLRRGVLMPQPASVFVDEDVNVERIAPGVVLHPGTRLEGPDLSIGPGCVIGGETPATVVDCQLGHEVALKGGFFTGSVFLDESSCGSGAHVRPGCLLEEEAGIAHTVGLKQTILFPFVTLGSLVNFCDVLMAGGTSRKDHSEVGSSFIHFNFTPHADKATASLFGDVPRGVLLDQPPIFLGGQGGVVGPCTAEFGTILAAGGVLREDMSEAGHLYRSADDGGFRHQAYTPGRIRDPIKKLRANVRFLGNLHALELWYRSFRQARMEDDPYRARCCEGALGVIASAKEERLRQMGKWIGLLTASGGEGPLIQAHWQQHERRVRDVLAAPETDEALRALAERPGDGNSSVPDAVHRLDASEKNLVFSRLNAHVEAVVCLFKPFV